MPNKQQFFRLPDISRPVGVRAKKNRPPHLAGQPTTKMNMKTKTTVAQGMREERRRWGWTQQELARRAGCTESQITKIETGRIAPDGALKQRLAEALRLETWELGV